MIVGFYLKRGSPKRREHVNFPHMRGIFPMGRAGVDEYRRVFRQ
jgi:hypothetical protein